MRRAWHLRTSRQRQRNQVIIHASSSADFFINGVRDDVRMLATYNVDVSRRCKAPTRSSSAAAAMAASSTA